MGDNKKKVPDGSIKEMMLAMEPDRFKGKISDFREVRDKIKQDKEDKASSKS